MVFIRRALGKDSYVGYNMRVLIPGRIKWVELAYDFRSHFGRVKNGIIDARALFTATSEVFFLVPCSHHLRISIEKIIFYFTAYHFKAIFLV